MHLLIAIIAVVCATLSPPMPAQPTPPLAPSFTIADAAFLGGAWQGEMNGGFVEEIWSAPRGNNIIGSFRWLKKDGKPMMFEVLAITQEPDAVRLRLRHYTADLKAKEAQDKPLTLKLTRTQALGGEPAAVFEAEKDAHDLDQVRYHLKDGTLNIDVVFKADADGNTPDPLRFRLKRTPVAAAAR